MDATVERAAVTDGGTILMQFFEATESGNADVARALVADDIVMEWPQSGERFSGRDNAFAAMSATEVKPQPAGPPRVTGTGDTWVVTMPLDYDGVVHHYVGIFEIRGGQIRRSTEYFAAPFPAQAGRSRYADAPTPS